MSVDGRAYSNTVFKVLDIVKNESDREITRGDMISIVECCGYTNGTIDGKAAEVFYRFEGTFPVETAKPYIFFIYGGSEEDSLLFTTMQGRYDISGKEPTTYEARAMTEESAVGIGKISASWLGQYTAMKRQVMELPALREILPKYQS